MYFNFLILIISALCSVYHGCNDNLVSCLIAVCAALINLPPAIKWFIDYIDNE